MGKILVMKIKLLLPALLLSAAAFAQRTVPAFYNFSVFDAKDNYVIVNTSGSLGEANSVGENVVWNFNGLTQNTTSATQVITPATADVSAYPGSTMLVQTETVTSNGTNTTKYFFAQDANGGLSLTGAVSTGFTLNYTTNNAYLGQFPMSYGYTNTDNNVAGSFVYGNYNGTFTGTGTTTVDAYGILTTNIGFANGTPVTRIKTVQNLNLTILGFPGTLTQTMYSYYANDLLNGPVFRSITNHIVVPIVSMDQTAETYESYVNTTNGTQQFSKVTLSLTPNPVNNVLHFSGVEGINKVTVIDAAGRSVLSGNGNDVFAGSLSAGVYYATAETEAGKQTVKFIKK